MLKNWATLKKINNGSFKVSLEESAEASWVGLETLSSTAEGVSLDLSNISASNIVDMRAGAFSSINEAKEC